MAIRRGPRSCGHDSSLQQGVNGPRTLVLRARFHDSREAARALSLGAIR
jgi:hypothetical protein